LRLMTAGAVMRAIPGEQWETPRAEDEDDDGRYSITDVPSPDVMPLHERVLSTASNDKDSSLTTSPRANKRTSSARKTFAPPLSRSTTQPMRPSPFKRVPSAPTSPAHRTSHGHSAGSLPEVIAWRPAGECEVSLFSQQLQHRPSISAPRSAVSPRTSRANNSAGAASPRSITSRAIHSAATARGNTHREHETRNENYFEQTLRPSSPSSESIQRTPWSPGSRAGYRESIGATYVNDINDPRGKSTRTGPLRSVELPVDDWTEDKTRTMISGHDGRVSFLATITAKPLPLRNPVPPVDRAPMNDLGLVIELPKEDPQVRAQAVKDIGTGAGGLEALQRKDGLHSCMPSSASQTSPAGMPAISLPHSSSSVYSRLLAVTITTTTTTTTTTMTVRSSRSATLGSHAYYCLSLRVRPTIVRRRVNPTFAKAPLSEQPRPRSVARASVSRMSSRSKAHGRRVTGLLDRLNGDAGNPQASSISMMPPPEDDGRAGRQSHRGRQQTTEEMRIPFINRYSQRQAYLWKTEDGYL
jgi:hypothetical protein